jgi:hypothetical protein
MSKKTSNRVAKRTEPGGRAAARIAGSNPARCMDVSCEYCVLSREGSLRRAKPSSREFIPSVVCLSVCVCVCECV